jgi:hypothetical protein
MFPYEGSNEPAPGGKEGEIQWFALSREPRVVLAYGVDGHFLAIRLAGGARVAISRLWIESWWQDVPKATEVKVLVAREVTIGGAPLASLVDRDPTSTSATVNGAEDIMDERVEKIWNPPSKQPVPIVFDVESQTALTVPLVDQPVP